MGMFSRIFRPAAHDADLLKSANGEMAAMHAMTGGGRRNPPQRGTAELLNMYNRSPYLRMVVKRISESVASACWHVGYSADKKTGRAIKAPLITRASGDARRDAVRGAMATGDFVELADHPLLVLLYGGNARMDGFAIRALTNTYLDLKGEAFWLLQSSALGVPDAVWPIPPHWVQSIPRSAADTYQIQTPAGPRHVPAEQVVWFREPDPVHPYGRGTGTGQALADELDTAEYAAMLLKASFFNRGMPAGIISIDGASAEATKAFAQLLESQHRGPAKFNRTHISNTKVDYKRIQEDFNELQVLPLRDSIRDIVQQTFGVPPELVGIVENSNRATIENAIYISARYVETPRLERDQRVYQRDLAPLFDDRLVVWYDSPIPDDKDRQDSAATAAVWAKTRNEWRAAQGLDPDPAGDVYMVPVNLIPEQQGKAPRAVDIPDKRSEVKALTKGDADTVRTVVDALKYERLTDATGPVWTQYMDDWGNAALADIGVEMSFNMLNSAVVEHLQAHAGERIKDLVNETTKRNLRDTLTEGIRAGEDHRRLRERVFETFLEGQMDIYTVRANRIARTEAGISANFTTWQAQKQSGVIHEREWLAAFVNTRPEHELLHGQRVGTDEPFEIDGMTAMYPGDFDEAYMSINCMCTVRSVIEDPKSASERETLWRAYVRELVPWRRAAEAALIKGFEAQLEDVLAVFDRLMPV